MSEAASFALNINRRRRQGSFIRLFTSVRIHIGSVRPYNLNCSWGKTSSIRSRSIRVGLIAGIKGKIKMRLSIGLHIQWGGELNLSRYQIQVNPGKNARHVRGCCCAPLRNSLPLPRQPRNLSLNILQHMAMKLEFHLAGGTLNFRTFGQDFQRKFILFSAKRAGDRQQLLQHCILHNQDGRLTF